MNVLLTNDDGIDAAGLRVLFESIQNLGADTVKVVAPARQFSQCGHTVTTNEDLKVEKLDESRFAVHGSPADCVRVAIHALGMKPDVVVSGINFGGNMGADLPISGTAAAAREAAYHGVRAAAFSHYHRKGLDLDWDQAGSWVSRILQERILGGPWTSGTFWNVNLPHLGPGEAADAPEIVETHPCRNPLPVEFENSGAGTWRYTGNYSEREREPGSDVDVCFSGKISVSVIPL